MLRIGDFKQYAGKTILNNVYMDLRGKKPVFKRTKTAMERNNIFAMRRNSLMSMRSLQKDCFEKIPTYGVEKTREEKQKRLTFKRFSSFLIMSI